MDNGILPYIVIGLTSGSVYALGGVGLVLTYKTSGIFNFGYGAIATVGAYAFYALHDQWHVDWPLAAFLSTVVVGTVLGFIFEPFARVLARRTLAIQVVATVGVLTFVESVFIIIYGQGSLIYPQFLPQETYQFLGVNISVTQIITMALILIVTAGLYFFFRQARLGIAMRGVVANPELLDIAGTSPRRVRRAAWIVGCIFAALSGVLLGPSVNLDAAILTLLVIQAFGAAAIGAFSNLPLTYAGGLLIGVIGSTLTKYVLTSSTILAGIPPSLPFLVLFVVMLVMPKRWLAAENRIVPVRPSWTAPGRIQIGAGVATLIVLGFVPQFVGFRIGQWTTGLIFMIFFLSLGLLIRTAGLVSLCILAFGAIGAAAFAHLSADGAGWPWLAALIMSGLIAVPVGILLAVPAIRLGGLYLALATFGFGILLQNMFYQSGFMFGTSSGYSAPFPHLSWIHLDTADGFYYVVLAVTVLVALVVVVINRSRLGRLLSAMADSPVALVTNGTSVNVTRVIVFSISAFLAAIGGALWAMSTTVADGTNFDPLVSLSLVLFVVITPGGAPWYALAAGLGFVVVPSYINLGSITNYIALIGGASAIFVALFGIPPVPVPVRAFIDRLGGRGRNPVPAAHRATADRPASQVLQVAGGDLEVSDLQVRFGGLVAVEGLSLTAPAGRITGMIGPNGAGKTTTFNACCGLVSPARGRVSFGGKDLTSSSPAVRARLGIGRTFQQVELSDSLSVARNVAIGREAPLAGANPYTQIISKRSDKLAIDDAVAESLELCGISDLANSLAGSLSTGQRRLVELARCLAGTFRILLLDEPSSGLDAAETAEFAKILKHIVAERGIGILLVEHNMALVMAVCQYIYVLDFGVPIFEGTASEVSESPIVQAAYLGTEATADTTQQREAEHTP